VRRLAAVVLVLVVTAACTGDEDGNDASPITGATAATGEGTTGAAGGGGGQGPAGPAPDACSLIAPEEVEAITGTNPGVGSTSGGEDRSICIYPSGFITAVEIAANFEASRDLIEQQGPIESVDGVGADAFWDANGQLVALGEDFFVGVTMTARNRAAREQAIRIATVMLESI
jgi:hypothetical protein